MNGEKMDIFDRPYSDIIDEMINEDYYDELEEKERMNKPRFGSEYWYVEDGEVVRTYYTGQLYDDDFRIKTGNYFLSEEEAMEHVLDF